MFPLPRIYFRRRHTSIALSLSPLLCILDYTSSLSLLCLSTQLNTTPSSNPTALITFSSALNVFVASVIGLWGRSAQISNFCEKVCFFIYLRSSIHTFFYIVILDKLQ